MKYKQHINRFFWFSRKGQTVCVILLLTITLLDKMPLSAKPLEIKPEVASTAQAISDTPQAAPGLCDDQINSHLYLPLIVGENNSLTQQPSLVASNQIKRSSSLRTSLGIQPAAFSSINYTFGAIASVGEANVFRVVVATASGELLYVSRFPTGAWSNYADLERMTGNLATYTELSLASGHRQLQLLAVDGEGHLWHTIRYSNGQWDEFGDVEGIAGERGTFTVVASTVITDNLHVLGATGDGHLWHTVRHADGSWDSFIDVEDAAGEHGTFRLLTAVNIANELHVAGVTTDGHLWYSIRHSDGKWASFTDVEQSVGDLGVFLKITGTTIGNELQLIGQASDSRLHHMTRHTNGSWSQVDVAFDWSIDRITVADVNGELQLLIDWGYELFHLIRRSDGTWNLLYTNLIGRFMSDRGIIYSKLASDQLSDGFHLTRVTLGGDLVHTIAHGADRWDSFGDVKEVAGERGYFVKVTNVGINGELHLVGLSTDGHLWHTIRHVDGSWDPFYDVELLAGKSGSFDDVSHDDVASNCVKGELHLTVAADNQLYHTIRHADGSWDPFHALELPPVSILIFNALTSAVVNDELHLVYAHLTFDNTEGPPSPPVPHLWHAIRRSDGHWDQFSEVNYPSGDYRMLTDMAAVTVQGELHLLTLKDDGTLQHTIRHSDGSWAGYENVKQLAGDVGTVLNVAATDNDGELYVVIMTNEGEGRLWSTTRHADGSWEPFSEIVTSQ